MSKNIMIIWASLIVLICGMLLILGYNLEDNKIERELKTAVSNYIKDNKTDDENTIVYLAELIDAKYLKDDKKYKDKCIKSVLVSKGIIADEYVINTECDKDEELIK